MRKNEYQWIHTNLTSQNYRYVGKERVWSSSHSGLVSLGPGISWTGNWF